MINSRQELMKKLSPNQKHRLKKKLRTLHLLEFHRCVKRVQDSAFKESQKNATSDESDTCVIVLDYMKKAQLGKGKVELKGSWAKYGLASVLGVVFYLPGIVEPVYTDLVSATVDQTCFASHVGLERAVRTTLELHPEAWKRVRRVEVWADCGSHFRGWVFVAYVLGALPKLLHSAGVPIVACFLNFFAEHHGKGPCDQHTPAGSSEKIKNFRPPDHAHSPAAL